MPFFQQKQAVAVKDRIDSIQHLGSVIEERQHRPKDFRRLYVGDDGSNGGGENGTGTMLHLSGTLTTYGAFTLGESPGDLGVYTISGGQLEAAGDDFIIGKAGIGQLTLDGSTAKVVGATGEEAKERGELAYQGWWLANYAGCGNCHGDDQKGLRMRDPATGELDPLVYAPFTPKLMGLKGAYIERQLINYRDGRRAGGMSAMKHSMAPLFLTPRLIQAIGAYAEDVHVVPQVEKMEATQ